MYTTMYVNTQIQAPTTVNSIVGFVLIAAGWLLLCSVVCYNFFKHHKAEKRRKEGYVAISGSSATAMNHHRQQQQQQCQHQHQHQHQPPYRYNQREAVLVNTHSLEPINHSNTNHDNPNTQHSYSSSGVSASGDYHSIDMDAHPGILSFSVGSDGGSDAGNSDSWSSEGYGIDSFNVGYTSPDLDLRRHNTSPGNMKVPFVTDARTHGLGQTDARSHSPLPPAYSAAIIATHDSPAVFHALAAQEGDVPPYMLQHTASAQN